MKSHSIRPRGRRPHLRHGVSLGAILGVIALLVVIVVVVLLVRDGGTAGGTEEEAQQQTEELQQDLTAADARARLESLRSAIESDVEQESLQQQYDDVRGDLEEVYADAEGEAAETWDAISDDLDTLGDQIGEANEDAANTIDGILEQLGDGNETP